MPKKSVGEHLQDVYDERSAAQTPEQTRRVHEINNEIAEIPNRGRTPEQEARVQELQAEKDTINVSYEEASRIAEERFAADEAPVYPRYLSHEERLAAKSEEAQTPGPRPGETVASYVERQEAAVKAEMPEATAGERAQTLWERMQATVAELGADESGAVRNFFTTAEQEARRTLNQTTAKIAREDIEYHALGQARAERAMVAARLEHFSKETEKLLPQHTEAIRDMQTSGFPRLDDPLTAMKFHIEDATGTAPNPFAVDHPLHQLAATLRDVVQDVRGRLEQNPLFNGMSFIEDYMRHMWTNPTKAEQVYGVGKQGSAASTQARRIPTEFEGILQGLTPKIANPVANTLHYVQGMLNYEASLNILQHGKDLGHIKYGRGAPEEGWVRLKGRASEIGTQDGGVLYAWAPSGYARIYNSWAGKGFYDHAWGGSIYGALQRASNISVGFKLGLSPFHLMTMAQEAAISGISRAIAAIKHGELLRATKDLGMSAVVFPELIHKVAYGRRLGEVYLEKVGGTPIDREVMKLWRDVGGAPAGHGQGIIQAQMQVSARDNMVRAFRQGRLGREIGEDFRAIGGKETEAPGVRAALAPLRTVGFGIDQVGRIMQTINGPLFDSMIPHLKRGAFGAELSDWLRRNPNATVEAQRTRARELRKAVDDRFGELDQDHLFWNRYLKQSLNLFSVSLGWEYGALRTFGAAARDIGAGRPIDSSRARWLPAFLAMSALQNNAMQYAYTGTFTWQTDTPWKDSFLAGRTSPDGSHRTISPGYQKEMIAAVTHALATPDAIGAMQEFLKYGGSKINPFWQMVEKFTTNTDWDDKSLRAKLQAQLGAPPTFWQYAKAVIEDGIVPIGLQQTGVNIAGHQLIQSIHKRDDPMSAWTEALLAQRPAGKAITDPEGYKNMLHAKHLREVQESARLQQKQNAALETPDPDVAEGTAKALADVKAELATLRGGGSGGSGSGRSGGTSKDSRGTRTYPDGSTSAYPTATTVLRGGGSGGDQGGGRVYPDGSRAPAKVKKAAPVRTRRTTTRRTRRRVRR